MRALAFALMLAASSVPSARLQERREPITAEQVRAAIDKLGVLEFPVRMAAARTVRRAEAGVAVPALLAAVQQHPDEYVRFRALVVLSGFNDSRTAGVMRQALGERNDRMRTVAYAYFEHHPDPSVVPALLKALDREESEFVRPSLTRALAAYTKDQKVAATMSALVMKGHDHFRASVIEALGDRRVASALGPIRDVAKLEGPLQDDAVLAMGKIGDKRSLETLAALQRSAPRNVQPSIAAAICLLGVNCGSHLGYLVKTLEFAIAHPGYQPLLRAAAGGIAALAVSGNQEAAGVLFERGAPTRDPERAAVALALGTIALRNTSVTLAVLEKQADLPGAVELLREAFDMLEEDFEEERFFVAVRRAYWQAKEGAPVRRVAETLIQRLEF